ncbi:hypothetical protein EK0264_05330 [Epidermidibacterium keratini]|uniref:Uncharacterized protein n=1 Tax=Epidermidibacterium keratini TaxID=1891644 RepID=A0A7L4YLP6_9ACTN|nr:hypothetical protein [Epidermidibacterium keratini]QHB99758.1 hypothetical protein EK0264_05330 [Epidermidibacterium keratini]
MKTTLRLTASATILIAVAAFASACGSEPKTAGPAEVRVAGNYQDEPPVSELIDDWQEPKGSGELAVPHLAIKETGFSTSTTLSYDVADAFAMTDDYDLEDGESLKAPEGREFLIVELELRNPPWRTPGGSSDSPVVVTITTDPMLYRVPVEIFERGEASLPTETILVTVQAGADVTLGLDDYIAGGGENTMNLRTGAEPEYSAFTYQGEETFYPLSAVGTEPPTTSAAAATATSSNSGSDGVVDQLLLTPEGPITRYAWTPTTGWASEGRCWLQFENMTLAAQGYSVPVPIYLDLWSAFSVLADGQPVESQARVIEYVVEGFPDRNLGTAYAEVPCDASTYTLMFAPDPKAVGADESADFGTWTPGTSEFSPPK